VESVLVIEDDLAYVRAVRRVLRGIVSIEGAHSVAQAQTVFPQHVWAALIIDIRLPDGDGLDVLEWIRSQGYRGSALVCTAVGDRESINRACMLSANYTIKPAESNVFTSFVIDALSGRGSAQMERWQKLYALSDAEVDVLQRASQGLSREEIANQRETSPLTTKQQIHTLLAKTGDPSLLAAVGRLLRERT
jgi:DNA-binding NarL/FixJ family response regulator